VSERSRAAVALGAVAVVGGALALVCARAGLEVGPDGAEYLGVAQRLTDGHGFTRAFGLPGERLDHYGPLLPAVLAPGELLGDARAWARVLHVALFALDTALVGLVTRRLARGALAPAVLAAVLFALTSPLLVVYASVLSEPLYLTLQLGFVLALVRAVERPHVRWLAVAGALAGLAVLARFVGVAMVGAGALVLLWRVAGGTRARVRGALVFLAVAVVPFAWWASTARLGGASPTDREVAWHPVTAEQAGEAVRAVGGWLVGTRVADDTAQVLGCLVLASAVVLAATVTWLRARRVARTGGGLEREVRTALLVTAASHAVVVLVTVSLLDRTTPLSPRILAPVYVCLLPVGAVALASLARRPGAARAVALVAVVALVGARGIDAARTVDEHDASRLRWAAPVWDRSAVVDASRALPEGTSVWSNAPDLVWYRTGIPASRVTKVRVTGYRGGDRLPGSDAALDRLRDRVAREGGVVVIVTGLSFRHELASVAELEAHGFERDESHADGVLLRP
jgi:4-amino-4-deoxy-L-arabinose transferase-like glycosyltransferase